MSVGWVQDGFVKGLLSAPRQVVEVPVSRASRLARLALFVAMCWLGYNALVFFVGNDKKSRFHFIFSAPQEIAPEQINVTFDDVRGVDEAKAELEEIVAYLKAPDHYARLGGRLPKGVLLVGPPGTGKVSRVGLPS